MATRASAALLLSLLSFAPALPAAAVSIDLVTIGNAGNAADTATCGPLNNLGCGSVGYEFRMGKHEVTNVQYAEFLNAAADADPNSLYLTSMSGSISRSGVSGSYVYAVVGSNANKPIPFADVLERRALRELAPERAAHRGPEQPHHRRWCVHPHARRDRGQLGRAQQRRPLLGPQRERVVQGRLLRPEHQRLLRLSDRLEHGADLFGAERDAEPRELQLRSGGPDRRGRLHGLAEPLRHLRPGWKRVGVDGQHRGRDPRSSRQRFQCGHHV